MEHLFETSIKENPRLNYNKFRLEYISYASSQCNEITGPTGLLAWVFSAATIPGNTVARVATIRAIFDIHDNRSKRRTSRERCKCYG